MTAPIKPWENMSNNQDTSFIHSTDHNGPVVRAVPRINTVPPLPPRSRAGAFAGGGHFSRYPYGMSGYGGMYGGYGGGYGFSPYGMRQTDFENRYVQMVEESAAPAFESIDGFVRGFSSVTMMLESTLQAMHMSFRTILGVAENMSRMKTAIFEFLSAMAILKTIYTFYRKVLYFLGLVNGADISWKEAEQAVAGRPSRTYWPMLGFLAVMIGGPTLISRYFLPNDVPEEEELEIMGVYDFDSEQPGELSFAKGDRMKVKKSGLKKGWIMATKGKSKGLIPYNRVALIKRRLPGEVEGLGKAPSNPPPQVPPTTNNIAPQAPQTTNNIVPQAPPITNNIAPQALPTTNNIVSQGPPRTHNIAPQAPPTTNIIVPQAPPTKNNIVPQAPPTTNIIVPQAPPTTNHIVPQVPPTTNHIVQQAPTPTKPPTSQTSEVSGAPRENTSITSPPSDAK